MAIRCGKRWRMFEGGMPDSVFLVPDGTHNPVGGDLCEYTSGKPSYKLTDGNSTPGSPSAEDLTLRFICVEGRYTIDVLNNPGYTSGAGTKPNVTQIGFQGSRVPNATAKTKAFIPITGGFMWVMTKKSATTVNIGSKYGIFRNVAGDYQIDGANTAAVVEVVGIDEEDYLQNGSSFTNYWVKACSPGGQV